VLADVKSHQIEIAGKSCGHCGKTDFIEFTALQNHKNPNMPRQMEELCQPETRKLYP